MGILASELKTGQIVYVIGHDDEVLEVRVTQVYTAFVHSERTDGKGGGAYDLMKWDYYTDRLEALYRSRKNLRDKMAKIAETYSAVEAEITSLKEERTP